MSKNISIISFLVITLILSGCESTGTIKGVSDGRGVQFEYQQGFLDNDGTLKVTMPDGEIYSGKFVQKTSSRSGDEWKIGESSGDDAFNLISSDTVFSEAEAILIGNRGNTMKCMFKLSDPSSGIDGGGIGSCKTSLDKPIHITF